MQTQMLVDEAIGELKSRIDDTAIIACSGGIDSTVAAVLAHKAVGSLLHCVYVDTGLMRKGETSEVSEMFSCLLYTSPSPRDPSISRMPSSA